ncbi:hypothetical protein LIER_18960 [Lithospermum erythrorhizon]|uniref:Integrase catalytic domain-containing protein n=1 Tax=Lithospermum erythrorhizon TaxID=34254 RepID=A0AAV3QJ31_LITER
MVCDASNFSLWKNCFILVFEGHGVLSHIDGSSVCPPPFISARDNSLSPNPAYVDWKRIDDMVLSWIQATISLDALRALIQPVAFFDPRPSHYHGNRGCPSRGHHNHQSRFSRGRNTKKFSPQWHNSSSLLGAPPGLGKNTHWTLVSYASPNPLYSIPTTQKVSLLPSTSSFPDHVLSSSTLWHMRLGHPGAIAFASLSRSSVIPVKHRLTTTHDCRPCQLGKHTRRPHPPNSGRTSSLFDLIHTDVWTSPIESVSSFKYYVVFLDDYSRFAWVYLLKNKSEVFRKFVIFYSLVETQFNGKIKAFQCDGALEYVRLTAFHDFLDDKGIHLRISCPAVHQQNGHVERFHHSLINCIHTLLF